MEEKNDIFDTQPTEITAVTTPPMTSDAPPKAEETYTLRHNGEEVQVDYDRLIACAQKGLDYDRIRSQRDQLKGSYTDFFAAHPEITDVSHIAPEVIRRVAEGEDIHTAYLSHENEQLRQQLSVLQGSSRPLPSPLVQEGTGTTDEFLKGLLS